MQQLLMEHLLVLGTELGSVDTMFAEYAQPRPHAASSLVQEGDVSLIVTQVYNYKLTNHVNGKYSCLTRGRN